MAISYGKMVIIGAGKVGSAILNSVLRMNILDEIVVVNRNQKKALGEVLDASHTTAFAYSANANIHVGGYEECADAQIIVVTAGPSIQPGNSRDRMVLLEKNVNVMNDIMEQILLLAKQQKSVLLISHRLTNITKADCIYVMENGEIKEAGTQEALLQKRGLYQKMWDTQQALEHYGKDGKNI